MSAKYLHIGIPVTNRVPGMTYVEDLKLWMSDPEAHDFNIEFLKFEEGGPFPEIMHKNSHVAYEVDNLEKYLALADQVIFGPAPLGDDCRMAFIIYHETIVELIAKK